MDTSIKYSEVPFGYIHCTKDECPMASTCLRNIAWHQLPARVESVATLNPAKASANEWCRYYRSSEPQRFARGFKSFKPKMLPPQYNYFRALGISHFGRNPFFDRCKGKILISPSEQTIIRQFLTKAGVETPFEFDGYTNHIEWKK